MIGRPEHGVLVAHDYFAIRGGGERLALTAATAMSAVLAYGYRTEESFPPEMFPSAAIDLDLWPLLRRRGARPLALAAAFAAFRGRAAAYPTRLFSGVAAPFAAPDKPGRNIYYCHTPPRFLYDQRERLSSSLPVALRWLSPAALELYKRGYEAAVGRMHTIVANSETVRRRITRYLGKESIVVHPPCDTDAFRWHGQGDYYLSAARLTPLKRVDRIVDAFLAMPDRRLIVASGGECLDALRRRAGNAPNIRFTGWCGEEQLRALIGEAVATIYVPVDEDFGMSPVEGMAAGKPCIGVREGGLIETIVEGETGILLDPDFTDADLVAAIHTMSPAKASAMRGACEARAADFGRPRFIEQLRAVMFDA